MAETAPSGPVGTAPAEETESTGLQRVLSYWRSVVGLLIALLIIAAIYSYASSQQEAAEMEAWKAIAVALQTEDKEVLARGLREAVEKHPSARAVFYARLRLISGAYEGDDLSAAKAAAAEFVRAHPDNPFAPQARVAYAKLLEWDGSWTAAREEYEAVIASGKRYLMPDARLGLARCLEQENRLAEAREAYLRVRTLGREERWPRRIVSAARLRLIALSDAQAAAASVAGEATAEPAVPAVAPAVEMGGGDAPADDAGAASGAPAPETAAPAAPAPETETETAAPAAAAPKPATPAAGETTE